MRAVSIATATFIALQASTAAHAQSFETGQSVYATPSGASNGWYSGCIVGAGRSNNSYQVECAGTVWWISAEHIRTTPPQPEPDPMRPGQIQTPVITPSHPAAAAATPRRATATPVARRATPAPAPAAQGDWAYAPAMARRIAQDRAEAANAVLKPGKYTCYSDGQYTFSDLYITSAHGYTVKPGGSGTFNYAKGTLTFLSGPYAGAYSRMVDGHTIGVSSKGNTNLGTQCGLEN